MEFKTHRASKLNIAASALATCAALGLVAGCASSPRAVSVQAGGSSAATTASASATPTRPVKPAAEQVPDSAVLTVTERTAPAPASAAGTGHSAVLTNAATIKEIAAYINALPTLPRYTGIVHCPMETVGSSLTLDFRAAAGGPVLAEVQLGPKPSGACSPGVKVTVGGTTEPVLDDSGHPNLFAQIAALAGVTSS